LLTHDALLLFVILIKYLNELWCLFRSTIRDKIIPHAVSWFTGVAVDGEGDKDEDEDDGDEDLYNDLDDCEV